MVNPVSAWCWLPCEASASVPAANRHLPPMRFRPTIIVPAASRGNRPLLARPQAEQPLDGSNTVLADAEQRHPQPTARGGGPPGRRRLAHGPLALPRHRAAGVRRHGGLSNACRRCRASAGRRAQLVLVVRHAAVDTTLAVVPASGMPTPTPTAPRLARPPGASRGPTRGWTGAHRRRRAPRDRAAAGRLWNGRPRRGPVATSAAWTRWPRACRAEALLADVYWQGWQRQRQSSADFGCRADAVRMSCAGGRQVQRGAVSAARVAQDVQHSARRCGGHVGVAAR